jgi:hypothetical protein
MRLVGRAGKYLLIKHKQLFCESLVRPDRRYQPLRVAVKLLFVMR